MSSNRVNLDQVAMMQCRNRYRRIQALIGFLETSLMAAAGNETRSFK